MALCNSLFSALGGATIAAVVVGVAFGATERQSVGSLGPDEGFFVDGKNFKIIKGKAWKDPTADLVKMGGRQVQEGAIVYRVGDRLYLADGMFVSGPQAVAPGAPLPSTIDGFNNLFRPYQEKALGQTTCDP